MSRIRRILGVCKHIEIRKVHTSTDLNKAMPIITVDWISNIIIASKVSIMFIPISVPIQETPPASDIQQQGQRHCVFFLVIFI